MSTQRFQPDPHKPEPTETRYINAIYEWLLTGAKNKEESLPLEDGLTLIISRGNLHSSGVFASININKNVSELTVPTPIDLYHRLASTPLQNRSSQTISFVHTIRMLRLVPISRIYPDHHMLNHLSTRFLRWYGPGNHSQYSREVFVENMYGNLTEEERDQMKSLLEAEFRGPVQPISS